VPAPFKLVSMQSVLADCEYGRWNRRVHSGDTVINGMGGRRGPSRGNDGSDQFLGQQIIAMNSVTPVLSRASRHHHGPLAEACGRVREAAA
jgi:hypothetical protein